MENSTIPPNAATGSAVIEETGSDEPTMSSPPPPAAEIGRLVGEKKFCAAARLYSETTGADLIESKLAIDRLASRHGLAPVRGCVSHFAMLLLLGGAASWAVSRWLSALL